ncbi:hypothetical protein TWF102_009572 [Orbilia oligospora]|uniref:RanBD1 domain-containing protein n=1 Tax=Orbilia oligospora TaxID=2813651 RepID=A0A7C8J2F0_ORBOL|nr:hypothetical protein TWF102_009572 [Orbilia oligospora]KAF3093769.1 hypothetical protein TWF706_008674 [Orbilia oligospora]KAF3100039.1 hypothetical protein TWF103_008546 [Orbilia oligospora]KAF3138096.1 hypothetical protein TWF594_007349 [Orbilia oligospora]
MVSTRRSKGSPPVLLAQDSDLYGGVLSQQSDIFPSALSQSYADSQPLFQSQSSPRNRKRRRSPRQNGSQSPTSGADSPKSDSSAREKMRKTRIEESEHIPKSSQENTDEMVDVQAGEVSPGGNRRKRPHDEIASTVKDAKTPASEAENRSPSRAANGEPLGKKLRETPSPPRDVDNTSAEKDVAKNGDLKPAAQKEELKIQPGSGFSNTSAVSPFGSLGTKAPENSSTDAHSGPQSGFATSKFSAFASSTSAFGVTPSPLAGSSPFAGPPTGPDNVFSKMSSASTQSAFPGPPPSGANVFAKMSGNIGGSGFGSSGFGAAMSPFSSSGSIFGNPLSAKPLPKAQPLEGIKGLDKSEVEDQDSENEDTDGEDTNELAASGEGESSKNPQFTSKVAIKSGEEDYDMVFQARAKLFELGGGAWKERGIGNIRVLVPKSEEEFEEPEASKRPTVGRIVMRQEGVGRLILNTSMFRNMLPDGRTPAENTIRLLAVNTVPLVEAQDEPENKKDPDDTQPRDAEEEGEEEEEEENGIADKKDEPQHSPDAKPVLKTYLLRFKGGDLAKTFKEHVSENLPE